MKKLIAVLLILVLFLPSAVLADDSLAGKWSFYWNSVDEPFDSLGDLVIMNIDLVLLSNHFASFVSYSAHRGDKNVVFDDPGRGFWFHVDGNEYYVELGGKRYTLILVDDTHLNFYMRENSVTPLTRLPSFKPVQEAAQ